MAEEEFIQNSGSLELPTNKAQAQAELMGATKEDKPSRKETLSTLKQRLQAIKAKGPLSYKRQTIKQEIVKNPSRFYSPDTTFGVDDGVRRLGRFPMGAGLKYNLPPLISTNAQGQARATLKVKKPPMFGGI